MRPSRARGRQTRARRDLGLDVTRHPFGNATRARIPTSRRLRDWKTRANARAGKKEIIDVVVVVIARTVVIVNAIVVVSFQREVTHRPGGRRSKRVCRKEASKTTKP